MTRYEVAAHFKEHWHLMNWKGDDHTEGVYFNQTHGYLLERTFCIRAVHNEPSPSVFYQPGLSEGEEDEVYAEYPYRDMVKKTNKYRYLYEGKALEQSSLESLFHDKGCRALSLPIHELKVLVEKIPKKRDRDRAWVHIEKNDDSTTAALIKKNASGYNVIETYKQRNHEDENEGKLSFIMNANTLLHFVNIFSYGNTVYFSPSHDRISITSDFSPLQVEGVISLPKETIHREIMYQIHANMQ